MRIFAVLLLLLNVAYLAWMLLAGRVQTPAEAVTVLPVQSEFVEAGATLMLVSERPPEPTVPAVVPPVADVANAVEVPVPQVEPWCAEVSGFASEDAAVAFLSAVRLLGGAGAIQSEDVPVSSTWWVHLPPFPSVEAAEPTLSELQSKQIDSYYIRTGELAGAISLGVFSRFERATIAVQELNAKGYSPSISEIVRREPRSKVSLRLEDAKTRQVAEWVNLEANLPDAELQEIACK
jgi:hypothetical protein